MALSKSTRSPDPQSSAHDLNEVVSPDSAYFAWPPRLWDGGELKAVPVDHAARHAPALSASDIERVTKGRLTKLHDKRTKLLGGKDARRKGDRDLNLGPWRSVTSHESDMAMAREIPPIGWSVPKWDGTSIPNTRDTEKQYEVITPALQSLASSSYGKTPLDAEVYPAVLVHQPISEDAKLAAQLADYQFFIRGGDNTWVWDYYQSLPSRIGHEPCLDLTCKAYLAAAQCRAGTVGTSLRSCYAALAKSIDSLQVTLREQKQPEGVRDTIIQSIALLAALEVTKGEHNLLNASHVEGIVSTLSSRANGEATDVSRSVLNYFSNEAMTHSIVKGAASPLEGLDATHYRSLESRLLADPIAKLDTLRMELCVRIPRLIALTRALRLADSGANRRASTPLSINILYDQAFALAEELYYVRDDAAEQALKTDVECPGTVFFKRRHFTFSSPVAWEAASMYWHVRFLVLRLCLAILRSPTAGTQDLAEIYPNSEGFLYQGNSAFSPAALEAETIRTGQNLLMSENIDKHNRPRRHRLRAQSFIVLWGGLKDLPQIDIEHEPGPNAADRSSTLRDRILEYTVRALRAPHLFFTEADMDEAADMFVGGPIRGSYARLYGWKKHWGG